MSSVELPRLLYDVVFTHGPDYLLPFAALALEAVGVVVVGTLSVVRPDLFPDQTVWSDFGVGYLFVPLVLPFVGLWWLLRNPPAA